MLISDNGEYMAVDWLSGKVVEKKQWNERLFSLRIQADFAGFQSGQFVRVALDIDGERVARPYSLSMCQGKICWKFILILCLKVRSHQN